MKRLGLAGLVISLLAQVAVYSPRALPSMLLAAAAVAAVVLFEEGRVSTARSAEKSAKDRECHHGPATGFDPSDPDGSLRRRGSL